MCARTTLSYVGGASSTASVSVLRRCAGRRCPKALTPAFSSPSAKCRAQALTAGVLPVNPAGAVDEPSPASTRVSSLRDSSASARASSALSCATSGSFSAELLLSLLFLLLRRKSAIHLSRSISGMTKKRTHSLELSSSGSMSRIRKQLAARCRRAIDIGRLVTASTCSAPNPPFLICGVLYIAGRVG